MFTFNQTLFWKFLKYSGLEIVFFILKQFMYNYINFRFFQL